MSGDCSAATAELSQQVSRLCLEEAVLACSASDGLKEVCRAVLGNHHIEYPPEFEIEAVMQENSQLVGRPPSFPVLCATNIAASWCALEEHTGRRFDIAELPVLVNGRDICFRANDAFYTVCKKWASRVGLLFPRGRMTFTLLSRKHVLDWITKHLRRPRGTSVPPSARRRTRCRHKNKTTPGIHSFFTKDQPKAGIPCACARPMSCQSMCPQVKELVELMDEDGTLAQGTP